VEVGLRLRALRGPGREEEIICVPAWDIEFVGALACAYREPVVGYLVGCEELVHEVQEGE
jgi:hypothetical protein